MFPANFKLKISKRQTIYSDLIDHGPNLHVTSAKHNVNDEDANLESELEAADSLGIASLIRLFAFDLSMKR